MSEGKERVSMNMKIQKASRDIIDQAAGIQGQTRTEFVMQAALSYANAVINDRIHPLSTEAFDVLLKAVDIKAEEKSVVAIKVEVVRSEDWKTMVRVYKRMSDGTLEEYECVYDPYSVADTFTRALILSAKLSANLKVPVDPLPKEL